MRARAPVKPLLIVLGVLFAVEFAVLAWHPTSRSDWMLENALSLLLVGILVATWRRFRLSRASYVLIFVFLTLHEIGAHYTYAEVPYDAAFRALLGWSPDEAFGFTRNHYDRLLHFAYGLTLTYPIREVFLRIADARGVWGYLLPLDVAMSTSAMYEIIEWQAALVFGDGVGTEFLGTQGDVWDAQWDMALAALGAFLAMAIAASVHAATRRDFARELAESLRVKHPDPLDEAGTAGGEAPLGGR
jgi:putative membrane protein